MTERKRLKKQRRVKRQKRILNIAKNNFSKSNWKKKLNLMKTL